MAGSFASSNVAEGRLVTLTPASAGAFSGSAFGLILTTGTTTASLDLSFSASDTATSVASGGAVSVSFVTDFTITGTGGFLPYTWAPPALNDLVLSANFTNPSAPYDTGPISLPAGNTYQIMWDPETTISLEVPEPASIAILGFALPAVCLTRRRKSAGKIVAPCRLEAIASIVGNTMAAENAAISGEARRELSKPFSGNRVPRSVRRDRNQQRQCRFMYLCWS
jgi:hypothetical protein